MIIIPVLVWAFVIMIFYFINNDHYLGVGTGLDSGYLFSENNAHILILIIVGFALYLHMRLNYGKSSKKTKKEQSTNIYEKITLTPFLISIFIFLFILVNVALVQYIRPPEKSNLISAVYHFALKGIPNYLYIFLLTITTYGAGSFIFKLLKIEIKDSLQKIISICSIGLVPIYLVLFLLGSIGKYNRISIIVVFIICIALGFSEIVRLIKAFFTTRIKIDTKLSPLVFLFGLVLLLVFANGFIDLTRPIGVGWDDITRYINYPKLLADSGRIPNGNFGWPSLVITGIGFAITKNTEWGHLLLFMTALWFQLLLFGGLLGIGKQMKLKYSGLLTSVIFLTTPMVTHQMVYDTKTDIVLTALLTCSLLFLFIWYTSKKTPLLLFAGLLAGMALGIKVTAAIGVVIIISLYLYKKARVTGITLMGSIISILFAFVAKDFVEQALINDVRFITLGFGLFLLASSAFLYYKNKSKIDLKPLFLEVGIIGVSIAITLLPILIKNLKETNFTLGIQPLFNGKIDNSKVSETDLLGDYSCEKQGFTEELVRYIGYEKTVKKYLVLPWNITMDNQIKKPYVDIGFILLGLLPTSFLFYIFLKYKKPELLTDKLGIITPLFLTFLLGMFFWNFVGQGVPWYGMFLFLFGLITLENIISKFKFEFQDRDFTYLSIIVALIMLMLYGIVSIKNDSDVSDVRTMMLTGVGLLVIVIVVPLLFLIYHTIFKMHKMYISVFAIIIVGILIQLGWRGYISSTQVLFAYATGRINEEETIDNTLAAYRYIKCTINGSYWLRDKVDCADNVKDESVASAPVYRIGTFIPFFIDNNNTRIFEDSRMDKINCFLNQYTDNDAALEKLKSLGFRYMIYDTNSETIESDPNGPVHQKVAKFEAWIKALDDEDKIIICYGGDYKKSIQYISLYPEISNCRLTTSDKL